MKPRRFSFKRVIAHTRGAHTHTHRETHRNTHVLHIVSYKLYAPRVTLAKQDDTSCQATQRPLSSCQQRAAFRLQIRKLHSNPEQINLVPLMLLNLHCFDGSIVSLRLYFFLPLKNWWNFANYFT